MWTTRDLADAAELLAHLQRERIYAAYAIGDLEPEQRALSTFAGAAQDGGPLQALALIYRGLATPALFVMGAPDGVRALLEAGYAPDKAYLTCQAAHVATLQAAYDWPQPAPMFRMALDGARWAPPPAAGPATLRLGPQHAAQVAELFALWEAVAFSAGQLESGVFYGVEAGGRLVAVAGTHLVSPRYGVAAVGNVFTHPDCRGRGYAAATVGAVVGELAARGVRDIVLNVAQGNRGAIRVYQRLGFAIDGPFLEGVAYRRGR
jgi:GNAT superfamily N-acetyltransferase